MFMRCSRALHTISPPSHHLRRRKESQERECLADAPSPAARNLFTHPPAEVKVANGKGRGQKRKAATSYVCKVWRERFSRANIELSINCSITVKGSAVYITDGGREGQRSHAGDYSTRGQWGDVGRTAMEGRAGRERKRTKPPRFI